MKKLLIVSALLAVTASAAMAQDGINLAWNECGTFGQANATFACNTNSGAPFTVVASFVAPAGGLPEYLGVAARIDIKSGAAVLPDWWQHGGTVCRGGTAMSSNFDFSLIFNCTDFWLGQAAGGFLYLPSGNPPLVGPDRASLLVQCAIPDGTQSAIDDVTEYYAFKINVTRTKTTGTGLCNGCAVPACIVLNEIQLFQPAALGYDPKINTPKDRNFVTWQASPGADCPAATPARSSSWGQVKSLYR